jgi:hypothetical protein
MRITLELSEPERGVYVPQAVSDDGDHALVESTESFRFESEGGLGVECPRPCCFGANHQTARSAASGAGSSQP